MRQPRHRRRDFLREEHVRAHCRPRRSFPRSARRRQSPLRPGQCLSQRSRHRPQSDVPRIACVRRAGRVQSRRLDPNLHAALVPRAASRSGRRCRQTRLLRKASRRRRRPGKARARNRQARPGPPQSRRRLPGAQRATHRRGCPPHSRRRPRQDRLRLRALQRAQRRQPHRHELVCRRIPPAQLALGSRSLRRHPRRAEHPRHRSVQLDARRATPSKPQQQVDATPSRTRATPGTTTR